MRREGDLVGAVNSWITLKQVRVIPCVQPISRLGVSPGSRENRG